MQLFIKVEGRNILDNSKCSVYLEISNGLQTISIKGSNLYAVDDLIRSWEHPWNISGLRNNKVYVPFSELLEAIYTIKVGSNIKLPWYTKVEQLLESSNTL